MSNILKRPTATSVTASLHHHCLDTGGLSSAKLQLRRREAETEICWHPQKTVLYTSLNADSASSQRA